MGKVSPFSPFKNPLKASLWGFAPNPTHFLKKASQKLLLAFGMAKTDVFANRVEGVTPLWEFEGETLKKKEEKENDSF